MSNNKSLTDRIRQTLSDRVAVEEKKMFGRTAFMVNGKMCLTGGADRMMCRIDPSIHEEALKRKGCHPMIMKGREYKGYVYVDEEFLQTESDLNYWVGLALDFNKKARATAKK